MQNSTQLTIVKANKVIEASYRLTLAEQRVLLVCIAQVDAMAALTEDFRFEVTASEMTELSGLKQTSDAYRDLQKASEKLYERSVILDEPDPDQPELQRRKFRWISGIDYLPSRGTLVLSFSAEIIPYLSQLSREFTQYKLKHVTHFESVYSIRLYELLVQWRAAGERVIEIDWLKHRFQVTNKYKRIVDLKKRVIDPAVREINEHTDIWVTYKQQKSGRTISHFCFQFGLKQVDEAKQSRQYLSEAEIQRQAKPGESRAEVVARLRGNSLAEFAKPGESREQAMGRNKEQLANVKEALRSAVQN